MEVDEDWPLGEACGEGAGVGECVAGEYVCAEGGMGVVCDGAIEPVAEACDGKDNDCDGLVDEGVRCRSKKRSFPIMQPSRRSMAGFWSHG